MTNWTKIWGNHSFKFGADIRSASNLRVPSDANRTGVLNFSHAGTASGGAGGLDLATFLFGDVSSFNRFVGTTAELMLLSTSGGTSFTVRTLGVLRRS